MGVNEENLQVMDVEMIPENRPMTIPTVHACDGVKIE